MDEVSDAVLYTMIPGQKPLVTNSPSVAVGLSKQKPGNLAGIAVNVGGEGQFVLPRNVSLTNETNNSYVTTTVSVKFFGFLFFSCLLVSFCFVFYLFLIVCLFVCLFVLLLLSIISRGKNLTFNFPLLFLR